jgi:hypothetical protein
VIEAIISVIDKYEIAENMKYIILNNTSLNDTCVEKILRHFGINDIKEQRRLRYFGYIINFAVNTFFSV